MSEIDYGHPIIEILARQVGSIFFHHWIVTYGISPILRWENGPQFVRKFLEPLCTFLGVKHLTTTAYHPESMGQAERSNKNIVARLHHYVAEYQRYPVVLVQPLKLGYSAQICHTMGKTSCSLVLSYQPPGHITVITLEALPTDAKFETSPGASTTAFYPVYPKCSTTPRLGWRPRNSGISSTTTPKCGSRATLRWSTRLYWEPIVVDICRRFNGRESIIQFPAMHSWPHCVISTESHTVSSDQDEITNKISSNRASLASSSSQTQEDKVEYEQ